MDKQGELLAALQAALKGDTVDISRILALATELAKDDPVFVRFFADAGIAWTKDEGPNFTFEKRPTSRSPVVSTGVSTRFNLFGYTVLEIYYAYPFQRPDKGAHFGFQIVPGW